jgi:hypothetical protein
MIEGFVQFTDVVRDDICQVPVLGLVPHIFDRINFRRISGKPLDLQPTSPSFLQLTDGRAMGRQSIANENKRTTQVGVDLTQKPNKVRRSSVVVQEFIVQAKSTCPWCASNCGQRGDSVMTIPHMLNRRHPSRGPHSAPQRLQQIATFVEKNDASFAFEALFLSAANLRGSTERWRSRPARGLAVSASADSIRACGANGARSLDGTAHRTAGQSCLGQVARSIRTPRSPNVAFLVTKPQPASSALRKRASAYAPDEASRATYSRGATPPSNDAPKRRSSQQPQLHPSMSFPAQTAELQSSGEFQATRDFLMVSCRHCSESSIKFPLTMSDSVGPSACRTHTHRTAPRRTLSASL